MTTPAVTTPDQFISSDISYSTTLLEYFDDMPQSYLISRLHEQGRDFFNKIESAYAELVVKGLPTPFWIHREYLELQSTFFKDQFQKVKQGSKLIVTVPSPDDFEPLLEYLYTGDGDKWYDSMNEDNWYDVYTNVEFLGLGIEARAICMAFYQNVILGDDLD
ncbi:19465_t:CDS:1 [Funneliformis geosporum]|uniref:5758_t:CDS:1 n=1 Tax=Funneliformis geosporum TaxID=1117311 RepID=A0A9W4SKM3_9GLOM|nr:5758_t:CDS:1 [Funneliformis geosporum]CAI2175424.1 19465_t:CDS:1 [Funneliformis geosporum]